MNVNTPIIVGVGQVVDYWDGEVAARAPSPLGLAAEAARSALTDTELHDLSRYVDYVAVVRSFADSLRKPVIPFGRVDNFPGALAERLGVNAATKVYSSVGGEQPQALVNELAQRLFLGKCELGLIAGAEATAAMKLALRRGHRLDWSCEGTGDFEDRGPQTDFISEYEISNGLGMPPQTYACLETALRGRLSLDKDRYLGLISEMFARFSEVASRNPYSQFREERSPEFLSTISKENYPVCEPYLKWHVAQDAVNQGAALIMTTVSTAKRLQIPAEKWVFLRGHAVVQDKLISERPDISRSLAMELAIGEALRASGLAATSIAHRDLYSCFPIVPYLAAEILGLNVRKDQLTVTGGLPFFGGPGNNYSTHAIASMVERLRANSDDYGLILANGGFLSKLAVGVYSAQAPDSWRPFRSEGARQAIENQAPVNLLSKDGSAAIVAYGLRYARSVVDHCYVVAENTEGRYLAKVRPDHRTTMSEMAKVDELLGKTVEISSKAKVNTIINRNSIPQSESQNSGEPMDHLFLNNTYKHIKIERNGHVMEVTLNRPDSHNALHSEAHFELAEVFDAFEQDRSLWVAIITGSGNKAFCSGNDLKVTATGGDMSIPDSGFAGICSRMGREKPLIAAVNGLAFGGGMEIVLAADLAIADSHAQFALPEVKVGLFAGAGGLQRLTKQIGPKAAMDLILTGRAISADEARDLRIVNSVVNEGEALEAARRLAGTIVENSPSAIRASKRVLNGVDEIDQLQEALDKSVPEFRKLLKMKDAREGVSAFVERRKPEWRNE